MEYFRMKLSTEYGVLSGNTIGSIRHGLCRSDTCSAFRQACDTIAVRHPYLRVFVKALEKRVFAINILKVLPSVFTRSGTLNLTAIHMADQLCTVTYSQYRKPAPDTAQIDMKCIVLIDA